MSAAHLRRIILTTDFSSCANRAIPYAVGLARRHGAELVVLHVMPPFSLYLHGLDYKTYSEAVTKESRSRLETLDLGMTTGVSVRREMVGDAPSAAAGITECAEREGADLIAMACHGHRPLTQFLLGSVARRVIQTAHCPVFCVTHDETGLLDEEGREIEMRRIVVPTDLSQASGGALELAVLFAKTHDATIDLLYILHHDLRAILPLPKESPLFGIGPEVRSRLEIELERFLGTCDTGGVDVGISIEEGGPARKIAEFAEARGADLIVLSRKGLGKAPHLLGGVAERLLHGSPCPMVLV